MKKSIIIVFLTFFYAYTTAQSFLLKGKIFDWETSKPITDVKITNKNTNKHFFSDTNGFFQIKVTGNKKIKLTFEHLNYDYFEKNISINCDTFITIKLKHRNFIIEPVTVSAKSFQREEDFSLSGEKLRLLPAFGGEADIFKTIQLTPGVVPEGENSAKFSVRGGDNSQNLILLDGVPVFAPYHIFGFVSAINPDIVKNIKFFNDNFPARFGGKISSVTEINLLNGHNDSTSKILDLGLISSKFLFAKTFKKNYFFISARSTYLNLYLALRDLFLKKYLKYDHLKNIGFYDINFKYTLKATRHSYISFGIYYTDDFYLYGHKTEQNELHKNDDYLEKIQWNNFACYFKYNTFFKNINFNLTAALTNYKSLFLNKFEEGTPTKPDYEFIADIIYSKISDFYLKNNFYFNFNKVKITFGNDSYLHTFLSSAQSFYSKKDFENFNPSKLPFKKAIQSDFYWETRFTLINKLFFNLGMRFPFYFLQDTTFQNIEFRTNLNFKPNKNLLITTSFSKMSQFSFLLTNNTIGMPYEIWVPANKKTGFIKGRQYSLSLQHNKNNNLFKVSAYYKLMKGLIDLKDGLDTIDFFSYDNFIETSGLGKAYGIEILIKKQYKKFDFWFTYAYSRSFRKFEEINNGKWYPFKYDRPVNFRFVATYRISPEFVLSFDWVLMSGHTITMPQGMLINDVPFADRNFRYILYYPGRNNARMPTYHRADIGLKYHKNNKVTISLDIYNVYNRLNAYYFMFYFEDDRNLGVYKRVLFPLTPSISIRLDF